MPPSSPGPQASSCYHPSGEVEPSQEDRNLTVRLQRVGQLVGIPVLDHVIIGAAEDTGVGGPAGHPSHHSFQEQSDWGEY